MDRNALSNQIVEKTLYNKLSSMENEDVGEIERLRKKMNVIEVKIDDIYHHLLSSKTINPKEGLVNLLNIVSAMLLTVGLLILLIGYFGADDLMMLASAGISLAGLISMYISIILQSSRKAKGK